MVHPLQLQATLSCNPRFPVNCFYRQLESSLQAFKANICETFETWMSLIFLSSLFSSVLQDAFPERNLLNADPRENVLANKIVLCSFSRQARLEREAAERAAAASASSSRRRRKGPNQNKKNKKKKEDIFWIYWNLNRFNTFYLWLSADILLISCIFLLLYINETNKNKTFFSFVSKDLFQSVRYVPSASLHAHCLIPITVMVLFHRNLTQLWISALFFPTSSSRVRQKEKSRQPNFEICSEKKGVFSVYLKVPREILYFLHERLTIQFLIHCH